MVNRHEGIARRLDFNLGKPMRAPARLPCLEALKLAKAADAAASPPEYASLEHSRHHGAIVSLTWFQC